MKSGVRLLLALSALVLALIAVMGVGGLLLPRTHRVSRSAVFAQPRDSVWSVIADMEHSPAWRTDVTAVKRMPDRNGHPMWLQMTKEGSWPLEIAVERPPALLVAVVADSSAGFGGSWTYDVSTEAGRTRVTITETGFVANPFFRFLARYLFGLSSGIDNYLVALGHRFHEDVKPGDVVGV